MALMDDLQSNGALLADLDSEITRLTTKLTNFFGTTTSFTIVFPSRFRAIASSALASASSGSWNSPASFMISEKSGSPTAYS